MQTMVNEFRLPYMRGTKVLLTLEDHEAFIKGVVQYGSQHGLNVSGGIGHVEISGTSDINSAILIRDCIYKNYKVYNIRIYQNASFQFYIEKIFKFQHCSPAS